MGRNKLAQVPLVCGELRDAIGTDAIDADSLQSFPVLGVVGRPGNDSRVHGVRAGDEILVDERHLLPQVLRSHREERGHRIDVTRVLQHSGPHCRENALNSLDDAVVERVYGAGGVAFTDHAHDERLDAERLDLDVDGDISPNCIKNGGERRDLDILIQSELSELVISELGDAMTREAIRVDDRIVVHDDGAIARCVDVELDCLGPQLDAAEEGRDRVLWQELVGPPVGDLLGQRSAGRGQAFPRVVALGTMSAKL